jgi:hypothetical protein
MVASDVSVRGVSRALIPFCSFGSPEIAIDRFTLAASVSESVLCPVVKRGVSVMRHRVRRNVILDNMPEHGGQQ